MAKRNNNKEIDYSVYAESIAIINQFAIECSINFALDENLGGKQERVVF